MRLARRLPFWLLEDLPFAMRRLKKVGNKGNKEKLALGNEARIWKGFDVNCPTVYIQIYHVVRIRSIV